MVYCRQSYFGAVANLQRNFMVGWAACVMYLQVARLGLYTSSKK